MAEELARSPLEGRRDDLARIGAELVPFLAQVDLRIDPSLAERVIAEELETAFGGAHLSVVDVSANRVAIELTDAVRSELLSCVCSFDLEPPAWHAGRCAQTLVGRAQVILQEREATTGILVRPSFADYVVDLLLAARDAIDVRP